MLILNFALNGNIVLACDLCGEDFNQAIEANEIQLVKFSDENFEQEDDEITYLLPSDYKIDVSKYIFDFICLNIPMKRTHKLGNCDEETLENINTESENEQEIDPRWEKLKKLRNN